MSISGYASSMSVTANGQIGFHLSSDTPGQATLTIQRIGATNVQSSLITNVVTQLVSSQKPWEGYGWSQNCVFRVPASWPTGLYSLFDTNGGDPLNNVILRFVVLPSNPGASSSVLLRISFLTDQAYNPNLQPKLKMYVAGKLCVADLVGHPEVIRTKPGSRANW